jgi:hypothetical protein
MVHPGNGKIICSERGYGSPRAARFADQIGGVARVRQEPG